MNESEDGGAEARSSPVHSTDLHTALQLSVMARPRCYEAAAIRVGVLESSQSQAAAQISWDSTLGGVTPLGGDGGHRRRREREAGARQGIMMTL